MKTETVTRARERTDVDEQYAAQARERMTEIVDEMGAMTRKLAAAKLLTDKYDGLRKELIALASEDQPADKEIAVFGVNYVATITPQQMAREVTDKGALKRILGAERYLELSSVGLGIIDKCLTPDEIARCVTSSQTGARRCALAKR